MPTAQLTNALRLNPVYYDALLLRAHIYEQDGRRREAVGVLEKAIAPGGKEDENDLPVLVRLLAFQLTTEEETEIAAITGRIQAVLSVEADEQKVKSALRLCACAEDLLRGDGEAAVPAIMDIADAVLSGADGQTRQRARPLFALRRSVVPRGAAGPYRCPADPGFAVVRYGKVP